MSYFVVLALAVLLIGLIVRGTGRQQRLVGASEEICARVYRSFSPVPRLDISSAYGYPTFQVTFRSTSELRAAADAGLNLSFQREIGVLCKDQGSTSDPFSADLAVFFTYEGWLEEQVAQKYPSVDRH